MDENHIQVIQRGTLWAELLSRISGEPTGKMATRTDDQGEKADEKQENTATAVTIAIAPGHASLLSRRESKPPLRKRAANYRLKAPTAKLESKMFDEHDFQAAAVKRLRERKNWVKTTERILSSWETWVSIRQRSVIPLIWTIMSPLPKDSSTSFSYVVPMCLSFLVTRNRASRSSSYSSYSNSCKCWASMLSTSMRRLRRYKISRQILTR